MFLASAVQDQEFYFEEIVMPCTSNQTGFAELRIRNLSPDTSPGELAELFAAQRFHATDVRIEMFFPEELTGVQAIITVPIIQVVEAHAWACRFVAPRKTLGCCGGAEMKCLNPGLTLLLILRLPVLHRQRHSE